MVQLIPYLRNELHTVKLTAHSVVVIQLAKINNLAQLSQSHSHWQTSHTASQTVIQPASQPVSQHTS